MRRTVRLMPALFLIVFLCACTGVVRLEQPVHTGWLELAPGGALGQTFVSRYNGLQMVRLNLRSDERAVGSLTLRLYRAPGDGGALRQASLDIAAGAQAGKSAFRFDPLPDSGQADYYFEVTFDGEGRVEVAAADGEAYLQGSAYRDGAPLDAQAAFSMQYSPGLLAAGLAGDALRWAIYLLAAAFLFLLPGWALMDWAWSGWRELDWTARLALAGPVGLALYPLLFLWARLAGLQPGALFAWLPPLLLGGLHAWRKRSRAQTGVATAIPLPARARLASAEGSVTSLVFLLVLGSVALARFWAIRNLDAPLWGDSVQHAAITRLMLAHGGLFTSWEPIAPYETLTVHYGFSAAAALLSWLLRIPAEQAVLVAGQVLNLMAVLALYPLAILLARGSRWAGLAAVVVAGCLLPMPAFYVNWGRYAQLTGQAILPALMWMTMSLAEANLSPGRRFAGGLMAGLVLAGMSLCYYRAPIAYAVFVAVWGLMWVLRSTHRTLGAYSHLLTSLGVTAAAGLFWMLPWIPNIGGGELSEAVAAGVVNATPLAQRLADAQAWNSFGSYIPPVYVFLALAGVVWSSWHREPLPASFLLWVAAMVAYSFGGLIHLPAANMFQNFSILIMTYIPIGVLCGYLFGELVANIVYRNALPAYLAAGGLLLCLAAWGGKDQARIADPNAYALFTRPDLNAMSWIRENTDPEARFLVEGFTIYDGTTAVGSDGGWWIPLLGMRRNSMPPQYAMFNERPSRPDYSSQVTALVSTLESTPVASPAGLSALCAWDVTHVYIGQRQGKAGAGARQLFAPLDLLSSPAFTLQYHQDRVYIFALDPAACRERP